MNKMLINHLDKIFVTSDTATLLQELEVAHPAAKIMVMAAQMQESEIGDGSNLVIVLIGELLAQAEELILMGLHPADIISGYTKAYRKTLELIESPDLVFDRIDGKEIENKEKLTRAILAPMASKQYGYEQFLAPLVAEACLAVMPKNGFNFQVDNVRVVKILGGNLHQSSVIHGMVIPYPTIGKLKRIENASELMNFNVSEEKEIDNAIKAISDSGVKVIVTGETIDDMATHFIEKYGMIALKVPSKFELRRICKATKARPLVTLGPVRPEEQGFAACVSVQEIGSQKITVFEQGATDHVQVATILLRSSTHNILNDIERAIDDGVNTVRALTRDGRLVAGAGAFEIELARRLSEFSTQAPGLEQYALDRFAKSLEVVPRALAENAGQVAMDVISQLYAAHEKGHLHVGFDIEKNTVGEVAKEQGIVDLLYLKRQAIKLAIDAVLSILRVDAIIQSKPAGGPKGKQGGGHWDDQE
jgi:T-complex protein 1 subunit theta